MGWNASAIFIRPAGNIEDKKLLDLFGYGDAVADAEPDYLEGVIFPAENALYIGRFDDVIVICQRDFPDRFFTEELSYIEQRLIDFFTGAEILAISLHSANNYYGYALLQDGEKVRMKAGAAGQYNPILYEMGAPLAEEAWLYALAKKNSRGENIFIFEDDPNHPFPEHAVGEEFVFSVAGRFFGERMDHSELFDEIKVQGYKKEKEEKELNEEEIQKLSKAGRTSFFRRYKFAIVIALLLLYYLIRSFWK